MTDKDAGYVAARLWCDVYARVLVSECWAKPASAEEQADRAVDAFRQRFTDGKFYPLTFEIDDKRT